MQSSVCLAKISFGAKLHADSYHRYRAPGGGEHTHFGLGNEHNIIMGENVARALAMKVDNGKPVITKWCQAAAEALSSASRAT